MRAVLLYHHQGFLPIAVRIFIEELNPMKPDWFRTLRFDYYMLTGLHPLDTHPLNTL